VVRAKEDSGPVLRWPGAEVRRFRDALHLLGPLTAPDLDWTVSWDAARPLSLPALGIELNNEELIRLGYDGPPGLFTVRLRQGGETCRPSGSTHRRSLKKLFQEAAIPPWKRDRAPLIYDGDRLICVYPYWLCQ
jgi:tRNA(Ile)-lysidine synthase